MGIERCHEVRNLNDKRVCDISYDGHIVVIGKGDCMTFITANADGTLCIKHRKKKMLKAS